MPNKFLRPSVQMQSRDSLFNRLSLSVSAHTRTENLQYPPQEQAEQQRYNHRRTTSFVSDTSASIPEDGVLPNPPPFGSNNTATGRPPRPQNPSASEQLLTNSMKSAASGEDSSSMAFQPNVNDLRSLLRQEGFDINQTAEDGNTPLAVAAFHGDVAVAELLVENGADTNLSTVQGAPPLYWAARNGHVDIIRLLCQHGADPNARARDGLAPLACAALEGHEPCVSLLLSLGAWPNLAVQDTQETPLYWAAHEGKYDCVVALLRHGAEPNRANRVGETPLFWAAQNGHAKCVKCLLEHDADPNAVTWDKQAAVFWAARNKHYDCLVLLLENGADPNVTTKTISRCVTTPLEAALHNFDRDCVRALHQHGVIEDFSVHKGWQENVDPEFWAFLLELDWSWESKQMLLESAIRQVRDDQILLKLLLARLPDVNRESCERRTIFLLMVELYLYILWIDCFVSIILKDINGNPGFTDYGGPTTMLVLTALFFVKEFLAAQQQGKRYLYDPWNWVDMAAIALTAAAMGKKIVHEKHDIIELGDLYRNVIIAAGAMICLSFIGYLKTTFLPFSNFVGGVTRICWDLIPFGFVTGIILLVFSFMYYVQDFDRDNGHETFLDAFLQVFSYFVGDPPSPAEGPLDVIFGVIMIIVLLNVVIAIVSSSWENAVNTSLILLVTHRFQLLRRSNDLLPKMFNGEWFVDKKLDNMMNAWITKTRDEYDFWIGTNRCHPACFIYSFLYVLCGIIQPIVTGVVWLLGLLTLGLLWPDYVRQNIFGIKPEKASVMFRLGQVEEQATKMATQSELMYGEIKLMNNNLQKATTTTTSNGGGSGGGAVNDGSISTSTTTATSRELVLMQGQLDGIQQQLGRMGGQQDNSSQMQNRISRLETQVREMDNDMKTLHTKVDLILEYLVNAANANQAGRPGLPDVTSSLRPNRPRGI